MPFQIQQLGGDYSSGGYDFTPKGGDWQWLSKQQFSWDSAWKSIGNAGAGKIGGGPSMQQAYEGLDPKRYTIIAPPPPTFNPILAGQRIGSTTRLGTVSLDLVDPFGSLAQLTGDAVGNDRPVAGTEGTGFDPGGFLASKNMDIFGQGATGIPARLSDYAVAIPVAILNKIQGKTTPAGTVDTAAGAYKFQLDPQYWRLVENADDKTLRSIATLVAARYIDYTRNGYLVQQLYDVMKQDQSRALALSSGNELTDLRAKKNAYNAHITGSPTFGPAGVVSNAGMGFPLIGEQLQILTSRPTQQASDAQIESWWKSMKPEDRQKALGYAGFQQTAGDLLVFIPAMSGVGAAMAMAKGAGGISGAVWRGYDTALKASSAVMAAGFTVAVANWTVEAAWPDLVPDWNEEIDRARPISSSSLAGLVNQVGFFSSATFGAYPAIQTGAKVLGKGLSAGEAGLSKVGVELTRLPKLGPADLEAYRVYGGSQTHNELVNEAGLDPNGYRTAMEATFMSQGMNWLERNRREIYEAALRGEKTGIESIDNMPFTEKQAAFNDALARGFEDGNVTLLNILQMGVRARQPKPINAGIEAEAAHARAVAVWQKFDDEIARHIATTYGPEFIASPRVAGAYTVDAMEKWARAKVTELGGDGNALSSHNLEDWAKIVRALHQYEFHYNNGELHAAMTKEALDEMGRLAIVRSDHVFRDEVDAAIATLKGDDAEAKAALVQSMIRTKAEAGDWFARQWKPKDGVQRTPENVPTGLFQKWLEDIAPALPTRRQNAAIENDTALLPVNAFQRKLDEAGTWTLAYKPVDAEGRFISYTHTSGGGVFKSPWVEYPLSVGDNIEMGNQGLFQNKMDNLFRGFRTWRLTEYQRGSLFRSLTSRFTFLPEQIDAFHQAVLEISRELHIQPQTVGTLGKLPEFAFGTKAEKMLQDAAERIFGKGPYKLADGSLAEINWNDVVAKSYNQSYKLNLTAGLTSHLKQLGGAGAAIAFGSDIIYVAYRFGLSPLFKGGELVESRLYNWMHGVGRGDPTTRALFLTGGIGNDYTVLTSEMAYDQMARGLNANGPQGSSARMAASMTFHARRIPEDFPLAASTASTQASANEFVAAHGGRPPIIPRRPYPPGAQIVNRIEDLPPDFTLTPDSGWTMPGEGDGLWHATVNLDGVMSHGLKTRNELEAYANDLATRIDAAEKVVSQTDRRANMAYYFENMRSQPAIWKYINPDNTMRIPVTTLRRLAQDGSLGSAGKIALQQLENVKREFPEWFVKEVAPGKTRAVTYYVGPKPDATHRLHQEWQDALGVVDPLREEFRKIGGTPAGLGGVVEGSTMGNYIHATVSEAMARARADRYRLAARVVQGKADTNDIIDHFIAAGSYPADDPAAIANGIMAYVGTKKLPHEYANMDELRAELADRYPYWDDRYMILRGLDDALPVTSDPGAIGKIGLPAHGSDWAWVQPEDIGVVKLAARKASIISEGPDPFDVRYEAPDVYAIDDRPDLPPIAYDNPDDLLKQLHETLAKEPPSYEGGLQSELASMVEADGTVTPGLEYRANEILDELERLQRTTGDEGPVLQFSDLGHDRQMEVLQQLQESGDLPQIWKERGTKYVLAYHGTPAGPFPKFLEAPMKERSMDVLYGPGVYLTEDLSVAKSYSTSMQVTNAAEKMGAQPRPFVHRVGIPADLKFIDLEKPITPDVRETILDWFRSRKDEQGIRQFEDQVFKVIDDPKMTMGSVVHEIRTSLMNYTMGMTANTLLAQRLAGMSGTEMLDLYNKLYFDLVDRLTKKGYAGFTHIGGRIMGDHDHVVRIVWNPDNAVVLTQGIGVYKGVQEAYERLQRRPNAASNLEDVAGTPEAFGRVLTDTAKERVAVPRKNAVDRAWQTFLHPADYKQSKALDLQINLMEREFPDLLRASGNEGVIQVFKQLGIREDRWARWLLEDRKLMGDWMEKGTQESWDAMTAHAGGEPTRQNFDDLYASPQWQTISALWMLNAKTAADEAFQTHFFAPYRSAFERGINHPVLGIYPASWAYKAAREWGKFLFDNRTFDDLHLGMAPAQAIATITRAQATAFAMYGNDQTLDEYMQKGPLGSSLFIFNLLMPGDWSSLPFPLSRTIRETIREMQAGNLDASKILAANVDFMGAGRDLRLFGESLGEMRDLLMGPQPQKDPAKTLKLYSAKGVEATWAAEPRR